jgi:branched-chain amino acid transport system permease protein
MKDNTNFTLGLTSVMLLLFVLLPLILPMFWISLIIELLILGLAGMSVNLLLGYGGMMPFGHAAFYATGAYATAILLNRTSISPIMIFVLAPLIAALVGALFAFCLSKLYGFYFAIMTTAFSMLIWSLIRKWASLTGGDIGIASIAIPDFLSSINSVYYYTLTIVFLSVVVLWIIINSPFGWTLRAIKENSNRMIFTGISVPRHRYFAFVISSFFCGIAGSLYAIYSRTVFPEYAYWTASGDFVTMVILGGMNSFFGPMIGAFIWTFLRTIVTSYTIYWLLTIGIIILAVVLFMPEGIVGLFKSIFNRPSIRRKAKSILPNKYLTDG